MVKYGLLFPGQGSQTVGMGKELYETQSAARWVFDRANEILGKDIKKLCFLGPENELETTANSQPAIFTTSIATLNALIGKTGTVPAGDCPYFLPEHIKEFATLAMGLSLGEPTALVAAGSMSFEDGLRFVAKRGQFMEEASKKHPGKMACIIGMKLEDIEKLCKGIGGVQVANLNCPDQVVVSGYAERIALLGDLAERQGAKRVIMLKVSGAFHSELMKDAKEKLGAVLKDIEIKEPVIDFISNIDAEITKDPERIRTNLINQLDNKTLWEASVRKAVSLGVKEFLEVGAGTVLKGLLKKIDPSLNVIPLHTPEDIQGRFSNQSQTCPQN